MSLACAVLVIRLCVPADYAPAVEHGGMLKMVYADGSQAPRKTHGVMITVVHSDLVPSAPSRGFDRACAKDRCLYYLKHCEPHPLVCEYVYAMPNLYGGAPRPDPDDLAFERFRISTHSTAALRRAQAALSLKLDGGVRMPVARLVMERPSIEIPQCGVDPEPGCPDTPRMARARAEREAYRARRAATAK